MIDFKQQLKDYRKRNEFSYPYTMMQVEDVMFIDDKKMVSLEYIFYQKDAEYSLLENEYDKDKCLLGELNVGGENDTENKYYKNPQINLRDSNQDFLN